MTIADDENAHKIWLAVQSSHDVTEYVETSEERSRLYDFAIATGVASLPPGADAVVALNESLKKANRVFQKQHGHDFDHSDLVKDSIARMREVLPDGPLESPMLPSLDFLLGRGEQPAFGATPLMIAIDAALQAPVNGPSPMEPQKRIDIAVAIGTATLLPGSDLGKVLKATVERLEADGAPHAYLVRRSAGRMLRDYEHKGPEQNPEIMALGLLQYSAFEQYYLRKSAEPAPDDLRDVLGPNKVVPIRPRPEV